MTTHFSALAISTLVVLASIGIEAQRPVNDRDLEKMGVRQLPELPDDDAERAIVADVRKTPAENLDAALPPLELDAWLAGILLSYDPNATPVEWRLDRCEDFTTDFPGESASELCLVGKSENISPSAQKSLTLILVVGGWSQSGEGRWVIKPPAIRDLFIQTAADSLDIRSLSELTTAFSLPVEQWPAAEFELAVNASPLRALPGETVTFRIEVRNKGKRDAPRAEITFGVFLGETPADSKRSDYKWYPAIAAGRTVAVELPVELPEGRGVFNASVKVHSTRKRFKETVIPRKSTFLWVHQVTDPPGLPAVVPR